MRPEDLLTDEFLKQFKSRNALNDFLGQLQKRGIQKMLEGELDGHLGYDRYEQSANSNSRNGYGKKKSGLVMASQRSAYRVIEMPALIR